MSHTTQAASVPTSQPREHVQVLPPPDALADDVLCCILREIDAAGPAQAGPAAPACGNDAAPLPLQAQAVAGVVPANVYACLNLVLSGWVRVPAAPDRPLPAAFVTGPFRAPLQTMASAPLRSVSLVLQPWLLADWFGLVPARMVDVIRALEPPAGTAGAGRPALRRGGRPVPMTREGAGTAWTRALCERLAAGASDAAALEAALRGLSVARERPAPAARPRLDGLLREHGNVRDAALAAGLGERQFERRFSVAHGLAPKRWLRIKRFERGMAGMSAGSGAGLASLGALAAEAGYADQAHMTREFRDIAGHTPGRLRAALAGQAAGYWAFRPARVGFVQDPERGGA